MIKEKLKKILSINGVALIIGVLGSLASIFTVFVTKWDKQIDLRWFIFSLFVFLTIILIFAKLLYELWSEIKVKRYNKANAFRFMPQTNTLLVEQNDFLGYSAMVSIFYLDEGCEVEFGKGFVWNIQEEFIQVKILEIMEDFTNNYSKILEKIENNDSNELHKIIVKSYITYPNY